ncbi:MULTISPECIES: methionine ABC transporter permease [Geobacillus]|uniref:Methionine ABC transporter permease n=1 Tax=Geobacillus thermocatenulatus TaxID=33938 RepID=A0A226Q8J6_9BACL|nr:MULTISPECIES: methionine ABC transporter permease [Geobacillus]KPC99153.1 Methionine import system permease protein MetP [Geobacillus sp. BCO2]RAN22248.1 methionine ABC transporter permease [Geobacillus sp. A8]ASS98089.1 methionine ABC transporter permease [Geobacillus thermocatenulatus]KLR74535.1 methionine ABC transporter permease [Geobacillus sp. T6]OXB88833.1 methionine ABC transporter permease [Geobacillus thermocatenulatus]
MPLDTLIPELIKAFWDTLYMVGIALLAAIIAGLPLGVLLFVTDRGLFWENKPLQTVLGFLVNMVRSIPFIILLVALLPLTKLLVGTTIGPTAAAVSLSVAATPFFARIVETSLREVDKGVIEAATAVGATPWMIIKDVLLSDALPGIIHGLTITAISLISYSAMAGIVGGGGVGDLAIRFGYYRYDNTVMITTIIVLLCLVQIVQLAGDSVARWMDKR